jgi:hypothetical protein
MPWLGNLEKVMFFILAPAAVLLLAAITGCGPQARTHPRTARMSGAPLFAEPRTLTLSVGGVSDLEVRPTAATAPSHSAGWGRSEKSDHTCRTGWARSW